MLNLLLGLLISAISLPPRPAHYVTDNAGVIDAAVSARIEQKLTDFERHTSDQVIVYVDRKVPGDTTLEEMGAQAIREWGVGQKGKNNGVILFLFTEDRKMRIEVGYGLEGSLTDAKSRLITGTIMKPWLQRGDYGGAVEHGVDAILNTIGGESYEGSGKTVAEANAAGSGGIGIGIVITVVIAMFLFFAGIIIAVILFIRRLVRNAGGGAAFGTSASGSSWFSSDSSSSSDSGSSDSSSSFDSGSDFSGGGGDGGGGGSSDSW